MDGGMYKINMVVQGGPLQLTFRLSMILLLIMLREMKSLVRDMYLVIIHIAKYEMLGIK